MKRSIVLDKNYLQGSSAQAIRKLAAEHRLIMSGALFFELLTTSSEARRRCFAKLPQTENPVLLVDHVGGLLAAETRTGKSCGQPSNHRLGFRFRFNEALCADDYALPHDARAALDEHRALAEADAERFVDMSEAVPSLFPGLLRGNDAERRRALRGAEQTIGRLDAIHCFYNELPQFVAEVPNVVIRNHAGLGKWAHLRWLQVNMLFALNLYVRYSGGLRAQLTPKVRERLEHDVHDAQILAIGALEGGLATREQKLLNWWSILRPGVPALT